MTHPTAEQIANLRSLASDGRQLAVDMMEDIGDVQDVLVALGIAVGEVFRTVAQPERDELLEQWIDTLRLVLRERPDA